MALFLIASAATLNAQNAYIQNLALPRYIGRINYPIALWARNATTVPSHQHQHPAGVWIAAPPHRSQPEVGGGGIAVATTCPTHHRCTVN
ncbi:MAG: hypothetical protein R2818_04460 [Flavobacteriales bacterium]